MGCALCRLAFPIWGEKTNIEIASYTFHQVRNYHAIAYPRAHLTLDRKSRLLSRLLKVSIRC